MELTQRQYGAQWQDLRHEYFWDHAEALEAWACRSKMLAPTPERGPNITRPAGRSAGALSRQIVCGVIELGVQLIK